MRISSATLVFAALSSSQKEAIWHNATDARLLASSIMNNGQRFHYNWTTDRIFLVFPPLCKYSDIVLCYFGHK